jgi:uncharacterized membrane protein YeaQ/YmgE (transglycosylase-associated protein family)
VAKIVNRSGEGLVRDIILGVIGAVVGNAISPNSVWSESPA